MKSRNISRSHFTNFLWQCKLFSLQKHGDGTNNSLRECHQTCLGKQKVSRASSLKLNRNGGEHVNKSPSNHRVSNEMPKVSDSSSNTIKLNIDVSVNPNKLRKSSSVGQAHQDFSVYGAVSPTYKRTISDDLYKRLIKYNEESLKRATEDGYKGFMNPKITSAVIDSATDEKVRRKTGKGASAGDDAHLRVNKSRRNKYISRTCSAGTLIILEESFAGPNVRRRRETTDGVSAAEDLRRIRTRFREGAAGDCWGDEFDETIEEKAENAPRDVRTNLDEDTNGKDKIKEQQLPQQHSTNLREQNCNYLEKSSKTNDKHRDEIIKHPIQIVVSNDVSAEVEPINSIEHLKRPVNNTVLVNETKPVTRMYPCRDETLHRVVDENLVAAKESSLDEHKEDGRKKKLRRKYGERTTRKTLMTPDGDDNVVNCEGKKFDTLL